MDPLVAAPIASFYRLLLNRRTDSTPIRTDVDDRQFQSPVNSSNYGGNILICIVEGMKVIAGHRRAGRSSTGGVAGVCTGVTLISAKVEPLKYQGGINVIKYFCCDIPTYNATNEGRILMIGTTRHLMNLNLTNGQGHCKMSFYYPSSNEKSSEVEYFLL